MEGPTIQLFVTCLVDSLAPAVGRSTVDVLEKAGYRVGFPIDQGCCGQPAWAHENPCSATETTNVVFVTGPAGPAT